MAAVEEPKIIICTMFRAVHEAFAPYIGSLVASMQLCNVLGVSFDYWYPTGYSYVWRGRNDAAHKFLHETKAKYLICIDSDHAWNIEGFANLLKAPGDVVGAAYPCKNNWDFWSVQHHVVDDGSARPKVDPETGLIASVAVPTGFIKISRKAFEAIEANEPDNFYVEQNNKKVHGFFNHIIDKGGGAFGEDISFCKRAISAGIDIWIEPDITIHHYGTEAHSGNYYDFLLRQPGGSIKNIRELKGKHRGQTAHIVGLGMSLEHLTEDHFKTPGPIIVMYDGLNKLEQLNLNGKNPIYSLQKDNFVYKPCKTIEGVLVHSHESGQERPIDCNSIVYEFDNMRDLNLKQKDFSQMSATEIAFLMGCDDINYLCFDSITKNDHETWTIQEWPKENYSVQAKIMSQYLSDKSIKVTWTTPSDQRESI